MAKIMRSYKFRIKDPTGILQETSEQTASMWKKLIWVFQPVQDLSFYIYAFHPYYTMRIIGEASILNHSFMAGNYDEDGNPSFQCDIKKEISDEVYEQQIRHNLRFSAGVGDWVPDFDEETLFKQQHNPYSPNPSSYYLYKKLKQKVDFMIEKWGKYLPDWFVKQCQINPRLPSESQAQSISSFFLKYFFESYANPLGTRVKDKLSVEFSKAVAGYWASVVSYQLNPSKFTGKPRFPNHFTKSREFAVDCSHKQKGDAGTKIQQRKNKFYIQIPSTEYYRKVQKVVLLHHTHDWAKPLIATIQLKHKDTKILIVKQGNSYLFRIGQWKYQGSNIVSTQYINGEEIQVQFEDKQKDCFRCSLLDKSQITLNANILEVDLCDSPIKYFSVAELGRILKDKGFPLPSSKSLPDLYLKCCQSNLLPFPIKLQWSYFKQPHFYGGDFVIPFQPPRKIPEWQSVWDVDTYTQFNDVKFVPLQDGSFNVCVSYKIVTPLKIKKPVRVAAIDLNSKHHLCAIVFNFEWNPLFISAQPIRDILNYCKKQKAFLQQEQVKSLMGWFKHQHPGESNQQLTTRLNQMRKERKVKETHQMKDLEVYRNNAIGTFLFKVVKLIDQVLTEKQCDAVVFGLNKDWKRYQKQKAKKQYSQGKSIMSKNERRIFQSIPYKKLINLVKGKNEKAGRITATISEEYTSQASAIDKDIIPYFRENKLFFKIKGKEYVGRPTFSGIRQKEEGAKTNYLDWYCTKEGHYLPADINSALNILRVYLKDDTFLDAFHSFSYPHFLNF